jgi:hypothetical protein
VAEEATVDSERFDSLARLMVNGSTRRTFLRALTAVGVAVAVPRAAGATGRAATCLAPGRLCNADSECCHHLCRNGGCQCPAGTQQCGTTCGPADRDCGCLVAGQRHCNGVCVDRLTDRQNCGACGNVCRPSKTCSLGKCCPKGTINCNGVCKPKIDCSLPA